MNKWYKIQHASGFVEWMDEQTFNYQAGIGSLFGAKVLEKSTINPNKA